MPSGKTHDGLTWGAVFPLTFGIGTFGAGWGEAALFGAGFLFGGLMFGPDLDLPSVQVRRWGPLRGIWRPYQRMFRHRSGWTHGVFVGPLVRLVYLGLWAGALAGGILAVRAALGEPQVPWDRWLPEVSRAAGGIEPAGVAYGLLGIWGGSALHTVSDVVVSHAKRVLPFGKRRR